MLVKPLQLTILSMQSTENKTFYEKRAWKAKPFYGRNTTGIIIMFGLTFFKWNHKRRKGQDFHLNRSWPVRLLNIPESIDLLDEQTTKRAINLVLFLCKFGIFLRSAANQQYRPEELNYNQNYSFLVDKLRKLRGVQQLWSTLSLIVDFQCRVIFTRVCG